MEEKETGGEGRSNGGKKQWRGADKEGKWEKVLPRHTRHSFMELSHEYYNYHK